MSEGVLSSLQAAPTSTRPAVNSRWAPLPISAIATRPAACQRSS